MGSKCKKFVEALELINVANAHLKEIVSNLDRLKNVLDKINDVLGITIDINAKHIKDISYAVEQLRTNVEQSYNTLIIRALKENCIDIRFKV